MAAKRRVPTQERGQATQNAVIEGAARAFDRHGFGRTSLTHISEESGVSQGSIYFHFRSKEEIALAVVQEQHRRSYAVIQAVSENDLDAVDQLILISREIVDELLSDPVVRAGIHLALEEDALGVPAVGFYEQWVEGTASLVGRGVSEGTITSFLPPTNLGRTLIGFFTGVQLMSQATTRRSDLSATVKWAWLVLIRSMVTDSKRTSALTTLEGAFPGQARPVEPRQMSE